MPGFYDYEKWKQEKIDRGDWLEKDEYLKSRKRKREPVEEEPQKTAKVLRPHKEVLMMRKEIKVIIEEPCDSSFAIKRELIFDTETTGLSNNDRIVEFSLIELIDGIKTGRRLHKFLNPEFNIPKKAIEVHGITNERIADAPLFKDVVEDIITFIGHGTIIAHNARFDQRMLNNELERLGWEPYGNERFIDTLAMAKSLYPGESCKQDALCARFNINNIMREKTKLHSAYEDTVVLYHIYGKLCEELKKIDRTAYDFKIKSKK